MITTDLQNLAPGSVIDLYELDATNIGGSLFRWVPEVNELNNDIVWQGNTYSRFPIEVSGFARSGRGTQPRPTIRTSNIGGLVGVLVRDFEDMVGAKFTRRRTFVKYLDAVNFSGGNAQEDPNVALPDEIWFVDRKASENGIFIEFELASAMDLTNAKIPKRQVTQNVCAWQYRSAECGYTGGAVATIMDVITTDLAQDVCGHRVESCKLRFGANATLPFGGFSGAGGS
jgi:lambda family phage minor tail protein L